MISSHFFPRLNKGEISKSNLFHLKVNTKRERRTSNNKNHNNNNTAKQPPPTESNSTIGALVTGLTSTQANMSHEKNHADILTMKPTSIEFNNHSNGITHENGNHSPSKSLKLKVGNENNHESLSTTNGHHHHHPPANRNDHMYEIPSNIDSNPLSSFETPTVSSSDEQGNKHDESSHLSSTPFHNEHLSKNGVDSGVSSEITNNGMETERIHVDEESSSTSGIISSSIISAARLLETNINETTHQRESSPTSGVIIPEERRVTDRVKVFEAAANNDQSALKKQVTKNGTTKKVSPTGSSSNDNKQNGKRDQQISPSSTSTSESLDGQSANESKSSTTKNKTKRPSLKKQIQNLLKIDKTPSQDESTIIEEHTPVTNGKKSTTLNSTRNKRDNGKEDEYFIRFIYFINNFFFSIRLNDS